MHQSPQARKHQEGDGKCIFYFRYFFIFIFCSHLFCNGLDDARIHKFLEMVGKATLVEILDMSR